VEGTISRPVSFKYDCNDEFNWNLKACIRRCGLLLP